MSSVKQEIESLLQQLPDDCSFEDVQYHLYVLEKIKKGTNRAEQEGVVSHEDAKARFSRWIAK